MRRLCRMLIPDRQHTCLWSGDAALLCRLGPTGAGNEQIGVIGQVVLQLALLGITLDSTSIGHTALIEHFTAGFGIAVGVRR